MDQRPDVGRSQNGTQYALSMIYFLSDAHIGSLALPNAPELEERLCRLLERMGQDATQIWLLGDLFDFRFEYFWRQKEAHPHLVKTLQTLVQQGVEVHYMTGNHDIWLFGKLQKATGVIVHKTETEALLNGKHCFLAHGDGLVPSNLVQTYPRSVRKKIHRFMRLRKVFHNPVCQVFFRLLPPALGDRFGLAWARKSRLKELAHPVGYKGEAQEELLLFAKEKEQQTHFDYYIFGHRHIELDFALSTSSRVLILGDMFQQFTYAQMDDAGQITLQNDEQ